MKHRTKSVEETEGVAEELAGKLRGGECIALDGELGAGKTQFVRGLVRALGGNPRRVNSPTFVLLNVYDDGRLKLFHLDAYRVSGPQDFEGIGFGELLEQGGVVAVEWAQRVASLLPPRLVRVEFAVIDPSCREIEITFPS
ncbi:MAG TPA: tRNA (adenosine(37)-N6)-threonylcarbamoyltransferase complex ATPase subunit type 1 TsaE [Tepidisphaeraceae bacterium]|nr:tRNA (adenosine(37)-N6)-threonylcarbamoyltransferase complex ATPase subunit type 1 TsaE [Tepidisphaeraceae bacterium]